MSDHATTIRRFWETTESRDWAGLSTLLSPGLVYETEQTRERVRGGDGLVRLFAEFPGEWHLVVRRVVADDSGGSSVVDATLDGEPMTALTFFGFDDAGDHACAEAVTDRFEAVRNPRESGLCKRRNQNG